MAIARFPTIAIDCPDPGALATYASRIRSYCELDDPFCQYGGPGGSGHSAYTRKYTTNAAAFVVSKLG